MYAPPRSIFRSHSNYDVHRVTPEYIEKQQRAYCRTIRFRLRDVFRIHGPFLFGATVYIARLVRRIARLRRVLLRLQNMPRSTRLVSASFGVSPDAIHASGRALILWAASRHRPD